MHPGGNAAFAATAEVQFSAGKSVVVSRLNMTPEHFSRVLHELQAGGLIEVDGRTVRILDLEGLRSYGISQVS